MGYGGSGGDRHEVKTEEGGTISKFLVENEDAVDAGQDLVELE